MWVSGVVLSNRVSSQLLCRSENGCVGSGLTTEFIKVYCADGALSYLDRYVMCLAVISLRRVWARFAGSLFFSNEFTPFHENLSKYVLSWLSSVGEHTP